MAAPSFVDAQTGATDAGGAWSYTCQAGAVGDFYILHILIDGATAVVGVTGSTNINNLADSAGWTQIALVFVGDANEAQHWILCGRASSTSAPTISGSNNTSEDLYIRSYRFQDVSTGTTLATVIENATAGSTVNSVGTSATAANASVQTLGPDRLALNFVAVNDDNAISNFTGMSGGTWSQPVSPYADAGGTDGAIGLQIAYPARLEVSSSINDNAFVYGGSGTFEQVAQSFSAPASFTVSTLFVRLAKNGSPTDDILAEIQTDSSGAPSGVVIGSTATVQASSLAGVAYVQFLVNAPVTSGTTYWLVLRRSGSRDTSNNISAPYNNTGSVYASGTYAKRDSGAWSNVAADLQFWLMDAAGGTIDGGSGSIVDIDAWGVVGFALIGTTVASTGSLLLQNLSTRIIRRPYVTR